MAGLPVLQGLPIEVTFDDSLRVSQGKLIDSPDRGTEVHAATFLHQRRMVLETALLKRPAELRRILIHELFHFVWWRLGNAKRQDWEQLLAHECTRNTRGDLGWSAQWRKEALTASDRTLRSRRWREYACEAFCDTAAWLYARIPSGEHTLAPRFCAKRRLWFASILASGSLSI